MQPLDRVSSNLPVAQVTQRLHRPGGDEPELHRVLHRGRHRARVKASRRAPKPRGRARAQKSSPCPLTRRVWDFSFRPTLEL